MKQVRFEHSYCAFPAMPTLCCSGATTAIASVYAQAKDLNVKLHRYNTQYSGAEDVLKMFRRCVEDVLKVCKTLTSFGAALACHTPDASCRSTDTA
jgi:hypothetical protein